MATAKRKASSAATSGKGRRRSGGDDEKSLKVPPVAHKFLAWLGGKIFEDVRDGRSKVTERYGVPICLALADGNVTRAKKIARDAKTAHAALVKANRDNELRFGP